MACPEFRGQKKQTGARRHDRGKSYYVLIIIMTFIGYSKVTQYCGQCATGWRSTGRGLQLALAPDSILGVMYWIGVDIRIHGI